MSEKQEQKKKTAQQIYIDEAAEAGARKVLQLQHQQASINHYRAMEDLLWAYPRRVRMMKHPEEFQFFKVERSKSISIAPPPGTGVVDKIESAEMYVEARKRAYEHEMFRLYETEYAIAPFVDQPEFIVIRLVYFNEDVHGNYRGANARRLTWEEIAEALDSIGIHRSVTAIRRWRSSLVRDMTVMMFGADGALSVESHDNIRNNKMKQEDVHDNDSGKKTEQGEVHPQGN